MANATSIPLTTGENIAVGALSLGQVLVTDSTTRKLQGIGQQALEVALRGADFAALTAAPNATLTWTTQAGILVTHAAAKCVITVPAAADVTSWAVGAARTLAVGNTGGFGIGFAQIATVGYNYVAVNTAITTLAGSAVVPSATVLPPVYTVYRASAASYIIYAGA